MGFLTFGHKFVLKYVLTSIVVMSVIVFHFRWVPRVETLRNSKVFTEFVIPIENYFINWETEVNDFIEDLLFSLSQKTLNVVRESCVDSNTIIPLKTFWGSLVSYTPTNGPFGQATGLPTLKFWWMVGGLSPYSDFH